MNVDGRKRVIIKNVEPEIECGRFPIKRVVGERVRVTADIFADGHDSVAAVLRFKGPRAGRWKEAEMEYYDNDRWRGEFLVEELGVYRYIVEAWCDRFKTWQQDLAKKFKAGQNLGVDIRIGMQHIEEAAPRASQKDKRRLRELIDALSSSNDQEAAVDIALSSQLTVLMRKYPDRQLASVYERELVVWVDREKARFSTWYERFPRGCSPEPGKHGTLRDCERILPEVARMGFDVLYLPPIHPIGSTNRKGKNNASKPRRGDVGSPWAVGAKEGGHKAVHPKLGTLADFDHLLAKAREYGVEIAMDLVIQCSPDHPYVKQHPEWFRWRPDKTIQYAENPPKKYEDVLPLDFENDNWRELWDEIKSVVVFWIDRGVRIFRVDNPHSKTFAFWEWLITDLKAQYPDLIFLSEAFTRPKVMYHLAKLGFNQSYTYFTWRNTKSELTQYMSELTTTEIREYFRPNFWPNTPDILPENLQYGGRPAFMMRLVLAATLSSNYGIYGPAFELCVDDPLPGREEYMDSEKYEIIDWDWDKKGNLKDLIAAINKIRRENSALQETQNVKFFESDNEYLLCYAKTTDDLSNVVLVIVNLDPFHAQEGIVRVPIAEIGIPPDQPYLAHDLLSDTKFIWQGEKNYVELDPGVLPASILRIRKRLRRESDFDYFM